MNIRCVIFSSLVTCAIGSMLGVAVAEINQSDRYHPKAHVHYGWAGSAIGLFVGAGQEMIRQQAHQDDDQ